MSGQNSTPEKNTNLDAIDSRVQDCSADTTTDTFSTDNRRVITHALKVLQKWRLGKGTRGGDLVTHDPDLQGQSVCQRRHVDVRLALQCCGVIARDGP